MNPNTRIRIDCHAPGLVSSPHVQGEVPLWNLLPPALMLVP